MHLNSLEICFNKIIYFLNRIRVYEISIKLLIAIFCVRTLYSPQFRKNIPWLFLQLEFYLVIENHNNRIVTGE